AGVLVGVDDRAGEGDAGRTSAGGGGGVGRAARRPAAGVGVDRAGLGRGGLDRGAGCGAGLRRGLLRLVGGDGLGRGGRAAGIAPAFAVFADPVEQGAFEADVVTESFGLDPLVTEDFFPFGQEFLVETGLFDEVAGGGVGLFASGLGHGNHGGTDLR